LVGAAERGNEFQENGERKMRIFVIATAIIGWAALLGRYISGGDFESASLTAHYFSYFTVLSNVLAALTLTEMASRPPGSPNWLTRPSVVAATTLYMSVTGLSTLPPPVWLPHQWPVICDSFLHYLLPILFFGIWMIGMPKGCLSFSQIPRWLIFPLCYGIYSQIFGPFYRAFDVEDIGLAHVLSNTVWMSICFISLSANLVVIDRALSRQPTAGMAARLSGE
jgi:hypothetical protein